MTGGFGASFMYIPKMAEAQVHPETLQDASYTASIAGWNDFRNVRKWKKDDMYFSGRAGNSSMVLAYWYN